MSPDKLRKSNFFVVSEKKAVLHLFKEQILYNRIRLRCWSTSQSWGPLLSWGTPCQFDVVLEPKWGVLKSRLKMQTDAVRGVQKLTGFGWTSPKHQVLFSPWAAQTEVIICSGLTTVKKPQDSMEGLCIFSGLWPDYRSTVDWNLYFY